MNLKYKLIGFVNLFNIVPDFVLPIFKKEDKLYFQEGKDDEILKFGEAKQNIINKIIPFDKVCNNNINLLFDINSKPIYAFQENSKKVICGVSSVLMTYFKAYEPSNDVLKSEILDFLKDIPIEKNRKENHSQYNNIYYYGTGRRKHSVARVRVYPGSGKIIVNNRDIDSYFSLDTLKLIVCQPLTLTGTTEKFNVICTVAGGGVTGQAGAIRHGLSKALLQYNEDFRPVLKKAGYLTRDPRMKERKKYGLKSARRAPQFSKR